MQTKIEEQPFHSISLHFSGKTGIFLAFVIVLSALQLLPILAHHLFRTIALPAQKLAYINLGIRLLLFSLLLPFFKAGFYSIIFLKMNGQRINNSMFFRLARKNFLWFMFISILINSLHAILEAGLMPVVHILTDSSGQQFYANWFGHINNGFSFIIVLLFLFSYPLVILGFFSRQNLRPIRSLLKLVTTRLGKILPLVLLVLLKYMIASATGLLVQTQFVVFPIMLISVVIEFFAIVLAFQYLASSFYSDLDYDFEQS